MRIFLTLLAVIITGIIMLPAGLHLAGLHPKNTHEFDFNFDVEDIPIIATNHGVLNKPGELGGKKTGVFLSELSVPYFHFSEAGMDVDIASIEGGEIPVEPIPFFIKTPEDKAFESNNLSVSKLNNSLKISNLDFKDYSIIFIAGGWGAAYDLGFSENLGIKISDAYYNLDALIGGICHGVLGLLEPKPNGDYLISEKRMTGVTDKQIEELGIAFTPMHPEIELKKAGVEFESNTRSRDILQTIR